MPESTVISVFLQKEKFLCNKCRAKIKAFLTIARQFRSLRNFLLKNNAPLSPVFRSKAVHYFICSLSNSFCAVTFVNNNAAYKINRNKHENKLRVLFSDIFSYITTESGFTHQIRTDCRRSSTENGQTAAGKP